MNNAEKLEELIDKVKDSSKELRSFLSQIGETVSGPKGAEMPITVIVRNAEHKLRTYKNLNRPYDA